LNDHYERSSLPKNLSNVHKSSINERRNSLPLFEKARVEVYLPDLPKQAYQDLLNALDQEFTYTFGGCTIIRGLDGSYLSQAGLKLQDRITLIYTDTPYGFKENFEIISKYTDKLREAAFKALEEEAILVVVHEVYHSM
jgi:hypothetical protein